MERWKERKDEKLMSHREEGKRKGRSRIMEERREGKGMNSDDIKGNVEIREENRVERKR